jgi:hypothetical protein
MMYEIETGIEAPVKSRGREPKYPWRELDIGDSFFASVADAPGRSLRSSMIHAQKRYGLVLTSRTRVENGVKGIRIWRIE